MKSHVERQGIAIARLSACAATVAQKSGRVILYQFARFFVVSGYKTHGVCHQRFTVLHATLGHFHDALQQLPRAWHANKLAWLIDCRTVEASPKLHPARLLGFG